jgi:zinc transporter 1/2/3
MHVELDVIRVANDRNILSVVCAKVWAIFIGNLVHETVIAFCLGLQLTRVHKDDYRPVIIAAVAYSLMNPVGLALATAIFESAESNSCIDLANGLFQALTSGCFIYVTFCEILEGQITHKTSFMKIGAMFAGYSILAAFAAVPGSSAYHFDEPEASSQNSTCFSYKT